MDKIFVNFLPPWVETNIQPAFYDKESGSVLQQTARMYAKVNCLVRMFNKLSKETKETVEEYIAKFVELKDFVDTYFENLDVQDEINNKLDAMVEDGTLEEIIGHYIQSPATTDTLGTIKVGTGLEMDDTDHLNAIPATNDTLGAIKVGAGLEMDDTDHLNIVESEDYIDCESLTYDYTATNTNTVTKVKIHYSIIPAEYKPQLALSDPENVNTRLNGSDVNERVKATVMINAGTWNEDTNITDGILIDNHEIVAPAPIPQYDNRQYLTITDEGLLGAVANTTSGTALIEAGYKYVIPGFYTLYANGTDMTTGRDPDNLLARTFIAQRANGDYLVGVCSGNGIDENTGMSLQNIIDFLFNKISFNPTFVYDLDGGRSSQLLYKGIRQNELTSNYNRPCPNWIYFTNPNAKNPYLFQSQNATNKKLIADKISSRNVKSYDNTALTAMLLPETGLSVSTNSFARNIDGTLMDIHIRFVVASGTTLPSYTDLIGGLPQTFRPGLRYMAVKLVSDSFDSWKTFYTTHDDTKGTLTIRTRQSLDAGEYTLHMTYPIAI